jgi:oligopeptide/dipeptide ABC transporter ATP-binding protein
VQKEPPQEPLLQIRGLATHFFLPEGINKANDGVDLALDPGRITCIVGESGSGKSMIANAILQILRPPGRIVGGAMLWRLASGELVDLASLDPRGEQIRSIRGREIAMVFQEPMSALAPIHTIGSQMAAAIRLHLGLDRHAAKEHAIDVLRSVGMPRPAAQFDSYTFQLSGGLRQRAMIALALSCGPRLLIADEPTTALDVTTQAVILDLFKELQLQLGMAILFITHDLGVVAEIADDVAVMYLGKVVEMASVDDIFHRPSHPYTRALLKSVPRVGIDIGKSGNRIRGAVPDPLDRPRGCSFHPRCTEAVPGICNVLEPALTTLAGEGHVRCLLHEPGRVTAFRREREPVP